MDNKKVKTKIWLPTAKAFLKKSGALCGPVGEDSFYLDWCEYDGTLKVYQHFEEPMQMWDGNVGQGGYKLGVISLTADQLRGK
jgi:hypothetical protein